MEKPIFESDYDRYLSYLESERWNSLRNKRLEMDNFQCQICGNPKQLHVHHLFYPHTLGTETVNDLITLCADCHNMIETLKKSGAIEKRKTRITLDVHVRLPIDDSQYKEMRTKSLELLDEFKTDKNNGLLVVVYCGSYKSEGLIFTDISAVPKMKEKFGAENVALRINKWRY